MPTSESRANGRKWQWRKQLNEQFPQIPATFPAPQANLQIFAGICRIQAREEENTLLNSLRQGIFLLLGRRFGGKNDLAGEVSCEVGRFEREA